MKDIGELTRNVPPAAVVAHPSSEHLIPHDYCGCWKPPGCWGNGGFHFRFFGHQDVDRELQLALSKLPMGSGDDSRRNVERTVNDFCRLYTGQHVAYEQCPAYRAAVQQQIDERRAKAGKPRRSAMFDDGE